MIEVQEDANWLVMPLATLSALVLCVSSVLLIVRYSQKTATASPDATPTEVTQTVVRILFGTQTGTAENFSKQLATALGEQYGQHQSFVIEDVEDFDRDSVDSQEALFFIMATYGDGEPTDTAAEFVEWLTAKSEAVMNGDCPEIFKEKPFAVFALGNKTYEHFAATGKLVQKHLEVLGGDPLVPVGVGDDDDDIEADFATWLGAVLSAVQQGSVFRQSDTPGGAERQPVAYEVKVLEDNSALAAVEPRTGYAMGSGQAKVPQLLHVQHLRELHGSQSERSCVHVELELAPGMRYEAGDHVAVFGENLPEVVERACAALGHSPTTLFSIALPDPNPGMLDPPFPSPTTLRSALTHHCELQQPPDREALKALASLATDAAEAATLLQIASTEGGNDLSATSASGTSYASYIAAAQRSILDVLQEFPSAKPSLGVFFARLAPRMRPRYYSISSSPVATPQRLSITAAVVDAVAPSGRRHRGVATTHLAALHVAASTRIPGALRSSTFRLPRNSAIPVVMVGPGTGLAPFRGFLQERAAKQVAGETLGPAMLFFGCRHPEHDFIYQEELEEYTKSGVISMLSVAFSRMKAEKEYVQHHVLAHKQAVAKALSDGGYLYVCGDAKNMARDVHAAVQSAVKECNGCSDVDAKTFISDLQNQGRYMQDVW